jgi:peptidoglycan/LPS O-acetylase OafA/YrhL
MSEAEARDATRWAVLAAYRFVLAALVVFVHLSWVGVRSAFFYVPFGAVLCFLVISGYSIAASLEREPDGFYRRRFARIYPTYAAALLLAAALHALGDAQRIEFVTARTAPWAAVGSVLLLQGFLTPIWELVAPAWSLSVEVFYYALAPWLQRRGGREIAALGLASAALHVVHSRSTGAAYNHALHGVAAVGLGWAWLTGFVVRRFRTSPYAFWLAVLGAPTLYATFVWQDGRLGLVLVFLTGLLLTADLPFTLPAAWRRRCHTLGDVSYPLYLCHFPLFLLIGAAMTRAGEAIVLPPWWLLVGAALLVSASILRWVDRPARRWLVDRAPAPRGEVRLGIAGD